MKIILVVCILLIFEAQQIVGDPLWMNRVQRGEPSSYDSEMASPFIASVEPREMESQVYERFATPMSAIRKLEKRPYYG
ncbi:hypothetical protein EG68_03331 [Paragonimus skrjabini miyazakii]|uniref:Uncharacterized protein n=1 Tax=Paragonimus skrjabini miyazakii TaxID=59628 RepID=A0A8S9YXX9_9TREM|nr:hypothetical protein EG68_03331 [Paragonimus skrjabini miyazakii]